VLQRILTVLVTIPIGLLLVTIAVINRHPAQLVLDPFRPDNPAVSLSLPFYAFLFASLIAGVIAGGVAVWVRQGRWRNSARTRGRELHRWRAEADRLARERDEQLVRSKELLTVDR